MEKLNVVKEIMELIVIARKMSEIKYRRFENLFNLQILGRNKEAFHHARTASVLQQHWLEMKNWDLLQNQRKASNRVLDFAEIEQSLEWNGGWDRHISFEEMRLCKAAVLAERAWLEWEKVISLFFV